MKEKPVKETRYTRIALNMWMSSDSGVNWPLSAEETLRALEDGIGAAIRKRFKKTKRPNVHRERAAIVLSFRPRMPPKRER